MSEEQIQKQNEEKQEEKEEEKQESNNEEKKEVNGKKPSENTKKGRANPLNKQKLQRSSKAPQFPPITPPFQVQASFTQTRAL